MKLFKYQNLSRTLKKITFVITCVWIAGCFYVYGEQGRKEAWWDGYKKGLADAPKYAAPTETEDSTPSNVIPIDAEDEEAFAKALPIVRARIKLLKDGDRLLRLTMKNTGGDLETYAYVICISESQIALLAANGKFEQ